MRTFLRDTLMTVIIAAVIVLGLRATVQSIVVEGPSMALSFHDGQRILVSRVVYKLHEPERGDVIVFAPPLATNPTAILFIKRIIGLPGESVEIREGTVYLHTQDGKVVPLDEPYVTYRSTLSWQGGIIPPDEYFVLGDNRQNSDDSRRGWTVPRENITSKAWLTIWPPDKWGLTANYPLQEQIDNFSGSE